MPIFGFGLVGILMLGLWIFCIVDVITTDDADCRHLPKMAWLFVVLILSEIGAVIWLVAGRPQGIVRTQARKQPMSRFPEYDRPGRHIAGNPDDDEEFLRRCRERAEQQRQAAKNLKKPDED
jgi:hypothetical protein